MKQRIVDKKLLRRIASEGCLNHPGRAADPHHIQTRGAGGGDEESNVIAICRECHTAVHQIGMFRFCQKFPMTKLRLRTMGWTFNKDNKLERLVDDEKRID